MVRHQRIVITSLPIQKAYESSLIYFKNLGFSVVENIPNMHIKFERGSNWLGDTWQTKKIYLTLQFSTTQDNKVAITCIYDISALQYVGKIDLEKTDGEILGFRNYIAHIEREMDAKKTKRICPSCKREIPWDAVICPYCGYEFSKIEKREEGSIGKEKSVMQEVKHSKKCLACGKDVPIDALFCPYCGYKFNGYDIISTDQTETVIPITPTSIQSQQTSHTQKRYDVSSQNKELAEKYANYGVIWGILSILILSLLGIPAIYYGYKAHRLDHGKGMGGIVLGIIGLVVGTILDIILLALLGL